MSVQILRLRSSLLYDRIFPSRLGDGELALNFNATEPGLYFRDNTGTPQLIKVGPTYVGSTPPNAVPTGNISLSKGENWLDTSSTKILKIYDGTTWQSPKAVTAASATLFPTNPTDGQFHYLKSTTRLYVYNADTATWVDFTLGIPSYIAAGNTTAEVIDTGSDGRFVVTTEGTEQFRINSAGNAGFGTASPGSKVDIKGTLRLSGSSSGYVGLAPAAAAGSTTYTLPTADGSNERVLSTNGSGTLRWVTSLTRIKAYFYAGF